jgi:hypothetical protein
MKASHFNSLGEILSDERFSKNVELIHNIITAVLGVKPTVKATWNALHEIRLIL